MCKVCSGVAFHVFTIYNPNSPVYKHSVEVEGINKIYHFTIKHIFSIGNEVNV